MINAKKILKDPPYGVFSGDPKDKSIPPFGGYDLRAAAAFGREKIASTGKPMTKKEMEQFKK